MKNGDSAGVISRGEYTGVKRALQTSGREHETPFWRRGRWGNFFAVGRKRLRIARSMNVCIRSAIKRRVCMPLAQSTTKRTVFPRTFLRTTMKKSRAPCQRTAPQSSCERIKNRPQINVVHCRGNHGAGFRVLFFLARPGPLSASVPRIRSFDTMTGGASWSKRSELSPTWQSCNRTSRVSFPATN